MVYQALRSGFRAIDTAAQPKHYDEALVGIGMRRAIAEGQVTRAEIFLQTKFTSIHGQDPDRMPYDASLPLADQVRASIKSSLQNLRWDETDTESSYIDSLVLHSPMPTIQETLEAWQAMQSFVPHKVRNLGISNCNLFTLMELYERGEIRPAVVQNRFYPTTKYDIGLRKFCLDNNIVYQSFWTLSANPNLIRSAEVRRLAQLIQISPQAALYCLVLGLGNVVMLNGTTKEDHMVSDLAAIEKAYSFASLHPEDWTQALKSFKTLIGQPIET